MSFYFTKYQNLFNIFQLSDMNSSRLQVDSQNLLINIRGDKGRHQDWLYQFELWSKTKVMEYFFRFSLQILSV